MSKDGTWHDERLLMEETASGSKDAFRRIYEQSYGKVARYVKGFVKDETTAEDVLVQTYTIVWKNASTYQGSSRLTTWIIGIARNVAYKEFRKIKPAASFDEAYCHADYTSQRKPENNDRNEKTRQAVESLPPNMKEILEMAFFQDLTYPEISEVLGIPVNTVKTRIFHAKKALRNKLEKRNLSRHDL